MIKRSWTSLILNGSWLLAILPDSKFRRCLIKEEEWASLPAWKLAGAVDIPATVPGNFELDMLAAGLIDDPFINDNILKMRELEDRHLLYYKELEISAVDGADPYLILEGVDTVADVYWDGQHIGHTDNMLIPYEFCLSALTNGRHTLAIHIWPSLLMAMEDSSFGDMALPYCAASLHIRKPAHSFGWDIAPRLISGGLWRSVRLEFRPRIRIVDTYVTTMSLAEDRTSAQLAFYFQLAIAEIERLPDMRVSIKGVCEDSHFESEWPLWYSSGKYYLSLEDPRIWWPKNRGAQDLYTVTVTLYEGEQVLDTREFRFGVRTVELRRVHGEPGKEYFGFIVNNEPIFMNGTNWVPADAFHSRDASRIDRMLELVDDIGCNMIRCWGGNVYEDEPFFDRCDELGILVWQDFAMACGCYPQHAAMQEKLRREAEVIVKKLRQHPSLALWAGDNECDMSVLGRDPNSNVLTRKVLPEVLYSHDGMRPYLPSSPYIDEIDFARGNKLLMEDHLWGMRAYYKGDEYDKNGACFASEMGYHGCPSPSSIRRFISPANQWPPDNGEWILHGTAAESTESGCFGYRTQLMCSHVKLLFGRDMESLEDFALASQISQMEAYKHFIELFRAYKERCRGIIWWNIIDCWPQFSDSVVDYYFVKKLAYYAIREVQKPIAVLFREAKNGRIPLMLANDTRSLSRVQYAVYKVGEEGVQQIETGCAEALPDSLQEMAAISEPDEHSVFLVRWKCDRCEGHNYFLTGRPPYDFEWLKSQLTKCDCLHTEGF